MVQQLLPFPWQLNVTIQVKMWRKQVDFIDRIAWRHTAEFMANYFQKDAWRLYLAGCRLDLEDKNGTKRKAVEVVAQNVYFGDSKRDSDSGGYQSQQSSYGSSAPGYNRYQDIDSGFTEIDGDDELPF